MIVWDSINETFIFHVKNVAGFDKSDLAFGDSTWKKESFWHFWMFYQINVSYSNEFLATTMRLYKILSVRM